MAAKLQAMDYEAYLYEPASGGHGYGKDNRERPLSPRSATISCAAPSAGSRSAGNNPHLYLFATE
jgi:hypothetical protein